ncbi:carbohydrate-binding family 9-like protein [Sphingobacterium paludis]|uniref:Cellulose/xylan binding protein with CBM9 domain n=1 Tax=Sphingobacterium paludis TaxID=1476465 RepID=A0A4R7CXI7_9SPHI|nr:carbohydrate-binding family 9-like protein [Sphingobacterium paludis]TDS13253.1 cellulose/xylan binding protein with CBM9 domain [Sphingobacterium paludis]
MSKLIVEHLDIDAENLNYAHMAGKMEGLTWHAVDRHNWKGEYPYKPFVDFQIAHNGSAIILHYAVKEDFIKGQYVRPNESVWEDSCVEFFISFDQKKHYYNLEFNVVGTGLIGYGTQIKAERTRLNADTIMQVATTTSILSYQGRKQWNIILYIPIAVFAKSPIRSLAGLSAHANFYKCGDALPEPHFMSWAPISWPKPNFHLPEFFGELEFL